LGANDKGKTKRSHFIFAKAEEQAQGKGTLIDKKIGVKPADRYALLYLYNRLIDNIL
jgi:peroxiredoxin Q/BCP